MTSEEIETLKAELSAAKKFIADVNNSIHGSQGYFLSGDTVSEIEKLKARCNRLWQENERLKNRPQTKNRTGAMTYIVHIRRNADGKIIDLPWSSYSPEHPPWGGADDYMWSDGNYGCDCNREIFWCHATGEDDSDRGCGETVYSVRITDEAGIVLYQDDRWEALSHEQ